MHSYFIADETVYIRYEIRRDKHMLLNNALCTACRNMREDNLGAALLVSPLVASCHVPAASPLDLRLRLTDTNAH